MHRAVASTLPAEHHHAEVRSWSWIAIAIAR
jgi:hypothetical protein